MKLGKKEIKINLLLRILIAIGIGIGVGYIAPHWLVQVFETFNVIFSQFLGFLIPLLIVGFVTPAISEVGNKAGKVLVLTVILAYLSTTCAGLFSYFVGESTFPRLLTGVTAASLPDDGKIAVSPYFTITIPPMFDVMSALVLSFVLGICLAYMKAPVLRGAAEEFRNVISMTIGRVIIPLLPLYIFCIFLKMSYTGEVGPVLRAFAKIIVVIFVMHIILLLAQYCIAALFVKRNPFKMLLTMFPAYFTALGTQSSAATIPVTLRQTIAMGVSEDIAGFVVPLCATIHMAGSALKIVACALAIMIIQGMPYTTPMFIGFICMIGISMVAAPGVPGGSIMAALGILASILHFDENQQALMIALYIAMDSFGTACNVTGDGAIAQIVDRFFGNRKNPIPEEARIIQN